VGMAAAAGHGAAFSHGADTVQPHCYNLLPFSFLFSVLTDEVDPTILPLQLIWE